MSFGTVTITTSPTKILSSSESVFRTAAIVSNVSSGTIFLGFDDTVTTSNGTPLLENGTWQTNEPRAYQGELFGIVASSSSDARFQELI